MHAQSTVGLTFVTPIATLNIVIVKLSAAIRPCICETTCNPSHMDSMNQFCATACNPSHRVIVDFTCVTMLGDAMDHNYVTLLSVPAIL